MKSDRSGPLVAHNHQLARLVGADQKRNAELPHETVETGRVNRPQWSWVVGPAMAEAGF